MDHTPDDTQTLRRCVRDLAALTSLSAYWDRTDPPDIAEGLAEALLSSLNVDFVYVRAKGSVQESGWETARTDQGPAPDFRAREIGQLLDSLPKSGPSDPLPPIPNPFGEGEVRLAIAPIGYEGDCGFAVAGSPRPEFPTQADRLLLSVGANQAAIALQHKRIVKESALLAAIVLSSDDAIVSKDLNGIITSWNDGAERLFGYTAREAIGQSVTMLIPPDRQHEEPAILARLRRGERVEHFETIRRHKNGALLDISLTISPIRDAAGRIIGASKIARDIRDRKEAEKALKEADRRKDEFLATLAHELRNPLAPLRNALQIMRLSGDGQASANVRDMMERQLLQMVRLVDDLLDVSRISQGKIALHKERLTVATMVESALEISRPLIEAAHHVLTITLPPEPLLLDGDLTRLAQVLSNLLNNAAKYTPQGGHIGLTVEQDGGEVVLRVRDDGTGIPSEMLPRVFEIFAQLDRTLERAQGGLGIGLTLVRQLVEMHGGTVEAASEGSGRGSIFTVRLPLRKEELERMKEERRSDSSFSPHPSSLKVLVVDDNVDSARSLALLLQLAGNEVRTAHDGPTALEVAAAFVPNVVLLDIGMPGLSGLEVARRMRAMPQLRETVLIAQTGWGQEEDRRRSVEAGFNVHLVKPVDPASLQGLLAALPKTRV